MKFLFSTLLTCLVLIEPLFAKAEPSTSIKMICTSYSPKKNTVSLGCQGRALIALPERDEIIACDLIIRAGWNDTTTDNSLIEVKSGSVCKLKSGALKAATGSIAVTSISELTINPATVQLASVYTTLVHTPGSKIVRFCLTFLGKYGIKDDLACYDIKIGS